jgi:Fic family protein
MIWNWQQRDWPDFNWDPTLLGRAEERFLLGAGLVRGVTRHLPEADQTDLLAIALGDEAMTTSAIEGEVLERSSVQSSIRHQLGLDADDRGVPPAERGIGELMVDAYAQYAAPLDDATLCRWHRSLCLGRTDLRDVGRYRTHAEPMQIVSGRLDRPSVHFEAPPSAAIQAEMARFIKWFNDTGPGGPATLPALTRAGICHLYFESVHPFEDGNGRIGRALAEKAIAQSLGMPSVTALASTILRHRKEYYAELEAANKRQQADRWLRWFAGLCLEAQCSVQIRVEFLLAKTRLLDRLRDQLNPRQNKALLRMLAEGAEGFKGGMTAAKYLAITKTSPATARRDLAELVTLGVFTREGERRHTRHHLTLATQAIPRFVIDDHGDVHERPQP